MMKKPIINFLISVFSSVIVIIVYHMIYGEHKKEKVERYEVTVSSLLQDSSIPVYKNSFIVGYAMSENAGERYVFLKPSEAYKNIKRSWEAKLSILVVIPEGYEKNNLKSECLNGWISVFGDISWEKTYGGYVVKNVKRIDSIESMVPTSCDFLE